MGAREAKTCRRCDLVNPVAALVCDCGWFFGQDVDSLVGVLASRHNSRRARPRRRSIYVGVGLLLLFTLALFVTGALEIESFNRKPFITGNPWAKPGPP